MSTEQKKVEHTHEHGEEHDHQNCTDHDHGHELDGANRGDKKFRKAMNKMGLKPVSGINRVTIKKGKAFVISIDDPDVWKSPGSENSYVIFGKPNMDGLGGSAGQAQVNQFKNPVNPEGTQEQVPVTTQKAEQTAGQELSEQGLNPDNIKMVMEYTKCSKAQAIKVLRETNDDSVNAIMKLTK